MSHQQTLKQIHCRESGKLSDKWDIYLEIYDQLLLRHRKQNISLLEIGVQNGGSLETWAAYFENATKIIGCDINEKCADLHFDDQRIHVVVGDATNADTAKEIDEIAQLFDIIIEDGSHTSRDIVTLFAEFFPRLRPGGIYIAEDLHCCYWEEWGGGLCYPFSGIEYFKSLCDCLHANHWHRKDIRPTEYVNNIGRKYGVTVDLELLESILSVEFYDSVCVIKKAGHGKPIRLKNRVIGGSEEAVAPGPNELERSMPVYHQRETRLTGLVNLVNEVRSLSEDNARLEAEGEAILAELMQLKSSYSWRLTKPLRALMRAAKPLMRRRGIDPRG